MKLPLLVVWLVRLVAGSVYDVSPNDHYYPNTTCHHCHNLQHYLLNTTKYFTYNTQLLFLPGLHHLHTDLTIQNVHNISLIGSTTNGTTPDTVVQCNASVGIVLTNITNLTVTNITVRSCLGNKYNNATVLIKQCTNVQLRHVVIEESHNSYGIVGINILGDSHFSYITNNVLEILYNGSIVDVENHNLTIEHYHIIKGNDNHFQYKVKFIFMHKAYSVKVTVLHSSFQWLNDSDSIVHAFYADKSTISNKFLIKQCQFLNNEISLIDIRQPLAYVTPQYFIYIEDSLFSNNSFIEPSSLSSWFIFISRSPNVYITNCTFHNNINGTTIFKYKERKNFGGLLSLFVISNTTFSSSSAYTYGEFIRLVAVDLHLKGPVTFTNINGSRSIILLITSKITCSNYIEISRTQSTAIITHENDKYFNLFIKENTTVSITCNSFSKFSTIRVTNLQVYKYPPCFFQYTREPNQASDVNYKSYSIVFDNNIEISKLYTYSDLPLTHCSWLAQSAFHTAMPPEVNKQIIKYINISGTFHSLPQRAKKKRMCYCNTSTSYDCYRDALEPVYPGQIMTLHLYMDVNKITGFEHTDVTVTVANDIEMLQPTACIVTSNSVQIAKSHTCNALKYMVSFPNTTWCELFLKGCSDGIEKMEIFYIIQRPCPVGFMKINGICQCRQCHPFLKQFSINCNINDQLLSRPANSWILLQILHNISCVYHASLHCPFHYCLPHSSHHNFSTPNSQCQFNRSGILCGHCQQGLSTVFGSSQCQQCSNIYLFLIVPIAIAGLVLVLLLFILNLTVTDGTINAFILYVNIISINTPVFFPKFTPAYIFISIANLDLGIQTCFYNGMDDYAKMWLQLAFPFYLIFIAASLIIASRYSTTIQRLTARRALPVLATLFLLSYTKVLLVTSSVLFSYSKIIHLPTEHATFVWSVDANVTLLGVRFIILYLTCLILFLILIPFNVILLFTRTFSRFRCISKFRPLLDAYQGPYKIKFYYWSGMQLLIRIIFFAISSLDRDINLTIGIILLSILGCYHCTTYPFKNAIKNYQELVLVLNLQVMYTISLYGRESVTSIILSVMIAVAAVHFMFIVLYHIITYVHGGVIRQKMMLNINKLTRCLNSLSGRQQVQQFELENLTRDRIPEVIHHYDQFQEPLVGQLH